MILKRVPKIYIVILLFLVPVLLGIRYFISNKQVDFNAEVKPLINKKCISCHGGVKRQSGFSLLFRQEALAVNKSGKVAIIPGDAENSEMIKRLYLTDPEERMPYKHPPLSKDEISILKKWINEGAKWGDHWAYVAVEETPIPSVGVGPFGLFQTLADALKYIFKEVIIPIHANKVIFIIAPIVTMSLALIAWAVIPFSETLVLANINVGILYIFAVSSLGVYGIIMAGWASNSKYPFLGALRSAAQMVSYEVSIGLIIINVLLCAGSLNLVDIVLAQKNIWYAIPLFPMFVIFFISALAETNRPPFDLPEAEAELVAGYQTEYSGMMYALFWLGEYANILLLCALGSVLFLGGWLSPIDAYPFNAIPSPLWLIFKILFLFILFALVKAIVPRYRYDQLMRLGWKVFLPFSLFWVVLTASFLYFFNLLPK